MKKLLIIVLVICFAAPAFARRTDMMRSYGFGNKSREYAKERRYKSSGSKYQGYTTERRYRKPGYRYRRHYNNDTYMSRQDRYIGDRYPSEAGRMLYEKEHYNNYVDRNLYLKERRKLDLDQRRQKQR
jgi:hypothetical protein